MPRPERQGSMLKSKPSRSELAAALESCKQAFVGVGIISAVVNVLMLTGSIFMLQIYDRVLPSGSVPTLVGLAIFAGVLYCFQGVLDGIRTRILARIGSALDRPLNPRIFDILTRIPLRIRSQGDSLHVLRDMDQVRSYLTGLGPTAIFDLPWIPFYIAICFIFHPIIGIVATIGAFVLIILTIGTEFLTRKPSIAASTELAKRNTFAEAAHRNAEVLRAMGLSRRLGERFHTANEAYLTAQRRASDISGGFGAATRVLRMMLQSAILGIGAWLAIRQEVSPGVMIASSIMMSRALAPVELAIAHWRGFMAARQGWQRLGDFLTALPPEEEPMNLPQPASSLSVEGLCVAPPGSQTIFLQDISFTLAAGQGLGIIGPSGSGKSSLARSLVGVWPALRGAVRLDEASLDNWHFEQLGRHIGYLPQDIELFSGTIAENIARLETSPDAQAVVAAALAAHIHEMILRFPKGYETQIGNGGVMLSAGQRQRIGLARALYKDPFFVVLDEPNSNLDADGEAAVIAAITQVRQRNGIVVVIAHRRSAIASVDQILMLNEGRQQAFGPRDEMLQTLLLRKQFRGQNAKAKRLA